jgi:hypothetical protein
MNPVAANVTPGAVVDTGCSGEARLAAPREQRLPPEIGESEPACAATLAGSGTARSNARVPGRPDGHP